MGISKGKKTYGCIMAHILSPWKAKRSEEISNELGRTDTVVPTHEYTEVDKELSELEEKSPREGDWLHRLRPRRQPPVEVRAQSSEDVSQAVSRIKWQTLRHNGPLFPPDYQRLPKDVKFYYDDSAIELTEQAEEVATIYAKLLDTHYVRSHIFNENFFSNFRSCLTEEQRWHIVQFELCDFWEIFEHFRWLKTAGRPSPYFYSYTKQLEQKQYGYCYVDGERRPISEFRISPPGLIKRSPITMGLLRPRVLPEDITINCDENANPPRPPLGHSWQQVVHDHRVIWLYSWVDHCTGHTCYVRPKTMGYRTPSRMQLETARRLQQHLAGIRNEYRRWWSTEDWFLRQLSVAVYCIDQLAMSTAAGAAGDHEVQLCALRVKQLQMNETPGRHSGRRMFKLQLENGKQYMYTVHPQIRFNLGAFVAGRDAEELIFDELCPQQLEQHMEELMDGLTAQIFRICNASRKLEKYLDQLSPHASLCKQLQDYNSALEQIHVWCTHLPSAGICKQSLPRRTRQRYRSPAERRLQLISQKTKQLVKVTLPYLDPRITIAWCQRGHIPFHLIYDSIRLRSSLQWALKGTTKQFRF